MSSDTPTRLPRLMGASPDNTHARDDTHPETTPSSQDSAHEASLLESHNDFILSTSSADGGRHPKGKRKRTTTKDKMILEDAYTSNPKPDKQARLEIVQRVSLNEKEVQIWFQNRRQNDRRKSRPLSAEEVASMRYAGSFNSSDPINTVSAGYLQSSQLFSDSAATETLFVPSPDNPASASCPQDVQSTPLPACSGATSHAPESVAPAPAPTPLGYLANRWNLGASFSTPSRTVQQGDECFRRASFTASTSCSPDTSTYSTQSQSNVRLALSLEGKAELVCNAHSPDRMPPVRPRTGLQRSQSAIVLPPVSALIKATWRSSTRGRSRDVAAWVSAAHAEPHDELTEQAENESTGSAIAAISLLRSTSSSSILQPSGSGKRNASVTRDIQSDPTKKRKFNRTTSSVARLETSGESRKLKDSGCLDQLKVARLLSPTDSDKENLSPDDDGNPHRRRPLPSESSETREMSPSKTKLTNGRRTGIRVLQENAASLLSNRANIASLERRDSKTSKDRDIDIFQDPASAKKSKNPRRPAMGPQSENEVEKFMRGEQVSPSKKPDMDCVAGLLSLSQGAWR